MKNNFLCLLPLLILSMLVSVSCESRDGDWESMKWKTDAKMNKERIINVPVSGGTYVFACKNYSRFWLSVVIEDDKYVDIDDEREEYATGEWSSVKIEKNVMTVTVFPNNDNRTRLLEVTPTAGDIFSYFTFNQENGPLLNTLYNK